MELHLDTGRTNQIRVHLASKGCPVVGDRKYGHGNESSPIDRLCLHAKVLAFIHPVTEKNVRFESPVPKEFNRVLWAIGADVGMQGLNTLIHGWLRFRKYGKKYYNAVRRRNWLYITEIMDLSEYGGYDLSILRL